MMMLKMYFGDFTKWIPVVKYVHLWFWVCVFAMLTFIDAQQTLVPLPQFKQMKTNYPGYYHHGGLYRNHALLRMIGLKETKNLLIHDTTALRLSYTLNKIGGVHSLGKELIRLSKFGQDSIEGEDELQYIYLPIAYGPYLADKYGYPNISKMHEQDPMQTKHNFWGKQGILRVITYTTYGNQPKGHVALWDCNHFHQSKDWIAGHSLLTVEFWESPDSNCTGVLDNPTSGSDNTAPSTDNQSLLMKALMSNHSTSLRMKYLKSHILPKHARHSAKKLRDQKK